MRRLMVAFVALMLLLGPEGTLAASEDTAATGSFTQAGSLSKGRDFHTATVLPDGRILVVGGWDGEGVLASTEVWDPTMASFTPADSLAKARAGHTATSLPAGRILVVGGGNEDADPAMAEIWDPATAAFDPAGSLAEARDFHTATLLADGRVLVIGGMSADGDLLASAEVWDPQGAAFTPAGSLAEARRSHTATVLPDGGVLVVGGTGGGGVLDSAEVWDPATATFSVADSLGKARSLHTATRLSDGRVLVVGGGRKNRVLASAEVWDPATAVFVKAGSLAEARAVHTATLLPAGRVLVTGGYDGDDVLASAEVWDPATASFSPAGSLAEARGAHTATLLPDGRVLVIGGVNDDANDLASAEVWEPSDGSPPAKEPEASPASEAQASGALPGEASSVAARSAGAGEPAASPSTGVTPAPAATTAAGPKVRAVFFFSPTCPNCERVIADDLPGFFERSGGEAAVSVDESLDPGEVAFYFMSNGAFQVLAVDVSIDAGARMFSEDSERLGLGSAGVPRIDIADSHFTGSVDIPGRLPEIIDAGLAADGIDWPPVPGLAAALAPFPEAGQVPDAERTVDEPAVTPPAETLSTRERVTRDPALEAQFPDAVSGEPPAVEWRSSQAFVDGLPPGVTLLAERLVAEQGITLDDVTVAHASWTQGSITAMRLEEGDAMALFGPLLADMFSGDPHARWTHIEVAGKDVRTFSFAPGTMYLYPQGEVVWGVSAEEPALTEIFTARR